MRLAVLCVVVYLGAILAVPLNEDTIAVSDTDVSTRDSVLEQQLREIIEQLRDLMLNGSDDIPVLDPLAIEHTHLDLGLVGLDGSHVTASDTVVTGASTFVIDDLSLAIQGVLPPRYRLGLVAHIPVLGIEAGNYDLDVTIAGFRVFGNGQLKARVIEPKISADILVTQRLFPPIPIVLTITECRVTFHLTGFESEFTGLFDGNEFLNDFISLFLRNLIPEMVEFFEPELTELISTIVQEVGNEILGNLNIGDLLPQLAERASAIETPPKPEITM